MMLEARGWNLSPAQESLPTRRLLRCKAKLAALIAIDEEVHPSIAKITHPSNKITALSGRVLELSSHFTTDVRSTPFHYPFV
jgi:hypothetical protein